MIATDEEESKFRSTATVNITIKDTNDNSPTFPKNSYKLSVPEHSPNGTVISNFTVSPVLTSLLETFFGATLTLFFLSQAEDPDTMDQGKITYRLLPDSMCVN